MRFRYLKYSVAALLAFCTGMETGQAQPSGVSSALKIPRIKYSGGGDWYNDPSAEVNLLKYVQQNTGLDVDPRYEFVEVGSQQLLTYPIAFLTGHGNITLNEGEVKRLRTYLENGGFLYIDDDYGLDKAIRREMKKVFPGQEMVELPFSHGIYHIHFDFANGPPKTHEHDGKPARGFGLFHNGRLVVYYTYESNPSDGWADPQVHNDPDGKRQEALRFGTNIVVWALTR
jgi:hypothetical protein